MKLLASTVLALASAQGSGDYDYSAPADRNEYVAPATNYNDFGNNANTGYNFDFGARADFPGYALNCWEANWDTDNLINGKPMHIGGSDNNDERDWLPGAPNGNGWAGGKYQYGHKTNAGSNSATYTDWTDYSSFRHAGCLYESNGWVYNSDNYKAVHQLTWAGTDYFVNWFHVFNAHVKPSSYNKLANGAGTFELVMANPTYEGLGWLNWVATFGKSATFATNAYEEFADSTWTIPTSAAGNNISPLTWTLKTTNGGSFGWAYDDDTMGVYALGISVSSFPHNSLGKDFRFNIRVLHQIKECDDDACATNSYDDPSYFWYKVNKITVDFPFHVAYAMADLPRTGSGVTHDGGFATAGGCAVGTLCDAAGFTTNTWDGQGLYAQWDTTHTHTFNIIPPLDMGNHETAYSPKPRGNHSPTGHSMDWVPIVGYLFTEQSPSSFSCDNANTACASWCTYRNAATVAASSSMETECSKRFIIEGLLNSYDESMSKGHRGTHQEIWIQLAYAMRLSTYSSPFPYVHFMASEMAAGSIVPSCDLALVKNQNTCTVPAEHWSVP